MSRALPALAVLALLGAFPAPAPSATLPAIFTVEASVRFGAGETGRLRLEGSTLESSTLSFARPEDLGLRIAVGPLELFGPGGFPAGTRTRSLGRGAWRVDVPRPFAGGGRLSLVLDGSAGRFKVRARGFPATPLREAGPAAVPILLAAGSAQVSETVHFLEERPGRWEYRRVPVPRPPPGDGGGGGGGGVPPGSGGFTTLDQGWLSGIRTFRFEVVTDAATWAALWQQHGGAGAPPAVDFATEQVVGIWLGRRPTTGYSVAVRNVVAAQIIGAPGAPQGWMLDILEDQPGQGCRTGASESYPFHIVKIPQTGGGVMYELSSRTVNCP